MPATAPLVIERVSTKRLSGPGENASNTEEVTNSSSVAVSNIQLTFSMGYMGLCAIWFAYAITGVTSRMVLT